MAMTRAAASGDTPTPQPTGLTIGMAWDGRVDPDAALAAAERAEFVTEVVVAPIDAAAAAALAERRIRFTKLRSLPPGDSGLYNALNKVLAAARTPLIVFHGADDVLSAEAVADPVVVDAVAAAEASSLLVFTARLCSPSGTATGLFHHREGAGPATTLARRSAPLCPEVAYPTAVLQVMGGFDETFRIAGDVDLYFRVREKCDRRDVDRVLVDMRDGGLSSSARGARTVWRENRRIAQAHGHDVFFRQKVIAHLLLNGRHLLYRIGGEAFANRATDALRAIGGRPARFTLD